MNNSRPFGADHPPASLIIVDDEAAQMQALCDTLRDNGYVVTGFTNPALALKALETTQFDLLLSDLAMPGMDGIALLRAALAIDPDMVGIIMTGEGTVSSAVDAMKVGALDYILKPFKLSVVLPVLARALSVKQLRLRNTELERRLVARAAELELVNHELESFSYSVSHDLRAPLRAVTGFAAILSRKYAKDLPDDGRRVLTNIMEGAQRMDDLIEALLDFSRLTLVPIQRQRVCTVALVQDVVSEQRGLQPEREVDVHVEALPDCVGDPMLLKQVFANLISNAFKFTQQTEHAVITIGSHMQGTERVYSVRDNGAGFDMRYAGKLFEVFQRLHPEDEFTGTGVGLSIVSRIVKRHGGRVWASAAVDEGATFSFVLGEAISA
ncbi:MAG: response regulator [Burkholderiales bacterium]|nr:response regulator [Burkholderiales bacterium]